MRNPAFSHRGAALCTALLCFTSFPADAGTVRSSFYNGSSGIRYPFQPRFNRNVEMTVEAWVYREDGARCEAILSQGFSDSYWFGFCPRLRFYRSGGSFADADVDVPARQWTHVAASYDGSIVRFFIDGEPAGESPLSNAGASSVGDVWTGRDPAGVFPIGPFNFHGYLDEIRLWSTARSREEIRGGRFRQAEETMPGLEAVWHTGGPNEDVTDAVGVAPAGPPTSSAFGILPTRLQIPGFPVGRVTLDGAIDPLLEYGGAEQIVLRYSDGAVASDAVGYILHDGVSLVVGVRGARVPLSGPATGNISVCIDPDSSRDFIAEGDDFLVTVPLSGDPPAVRRGGAAFPRFGWGDPDPALASAVTAVVGPPGGSFTLPDIEIRIDAALLGGARFARETDGIAIAHRRIGAPPGTSFFPGNASLIGPVSWAPAFYEPACGSSLALALGAGWPGYDLSTALEVAFTPADGTPAGAEVVLSDSQGGNFASTPSPDSTEGVLGAVELPSDPESARVSIELKVHVPISGPDVFLLEHAVEVNRPMVDFGTGPEPADVAIRNAEALIEIGGPVRLPGACFSLGYLPRTPSGMVVTTFSRPALPSEPSFGSLVGYQLAREDEDGGAVLPIAFYLENPERKLVYESWFGIAEEIPFGAERSVRYEISGATAGVNADTVSTMVGHLAEAGPGSLRHLLEQNPDGAITFDPRLDGAAIVLQEGPLIFSDETLELDASGLPNGITLSTAMKSRVIEVGAEAAVTLRNVTIASGLSAGDGGGIFNEGTLTLIGCSVQNCTAGPKNEFKGGGIFNDGGTLQITDSTISGNAALDGGGIFSAGGVAVIERSIIANNLGEELGGALAAAGGAAVTVRDSSLLGSSAGSGAVSAFADGSVDLIQCTVHDSFGGAVRVGDGAVAIHHTTIAGNKGRDGRAGGIHADQGAGVEVFSSIIAGNEGGDLSGSEGSFTSLGFNVGGFGNSAAAFNAQGDQIQVQDPRLLLPALNGGGIPTMALAPGSPARDRGGAGQLTPITDQRGFPRLQGETVDAGAYEAGSRRAGFQAWAAESIPPHFDQSFHGDPDSDLVVTGLEYLRGSNPVIPDPDHAGKLRLEPGQTVQVSFGFASDTTGVAWHIVKSSDLEDPLVIAGLRESLLGEDHAEGSPIFVEGALLSIDDQIGQIRLIDPAADDSAFYQLGAFSLP